MQESTVRYPYKLLQLCPKSPAWFRVVICKRLIPQN
jgi:hypothetical protein